MAIVGSASILAWLNPAGFLTFLLLWAVLMFGMGYNNYDYHSRCKKPVRLMGYISLPGSTVMELVRMFNIVNGQFAGEKIERVQADEKEQAKYSVKQGDILVSRVNSRELVGKSCVFPGLEEPAVFEAMVIRLRCKSGSDSHFLASLMNSAHFLRELRSKAKHALGQAILIPLSSRVRA